MAISKKKYMMFEDMVYYIMDVIENPSSYDDNVKMRAADLLKVINEDILNMLKDGESAKLKTAGYKTLHAIDPGMN